MADSFKTRAILLLALVAAGTAGALLSKQWASGQSTVEVTQGPVIYLSDLPWDWATTGWVALADDNLPKLDTSFLNSPITIGGKSYDKGIGTFPLSEMVYPLEGRYRLFQADVGVDEAVPAGKGSVVFKLFLDDVLAYDSGPLMAGMEAQPVELSVAGVGKMKLVVEDAGDGSSLDYADWASARLTPAGREGTNSASPLLKGLEASRSERQQARDLDRATVQQRADQESAALTRVMREDPRASSQATALFDDDRRMMVLTNGKLALTLGYGGEHHGLLSAINLEAGRMVLSDTTPSLTATDLSTLTLSRHTIPMEGEGFRFQRVEDPALGQGMEVTADFQVPEAGVVISPRLTLFDGSNYFTYQLELREVEPSVAVHRFSFFDPQKGGYLLVGEDALYLSDNSLMRRADVRDDSILRQEPVGLGKPLVLYSRALSRGILMAIIDEVPDPARFSLQVETGHVTGHMGFEYPVPEDVRATRIQTSPRLFFQVTSGGGLQQASSQYRQIMDRLYPQPPLPDWVKYQWGSWYAYYMNYDEDAIRGQIDYIAENLSDLGPWSVLLDAGWYVAEGRPDSGWEVDQDKFPSGLRSLVDYAHSRGIKVVLYFSAPYLDDREREGNWLGLSGFIEQHPDWVIPLQSDNTGASYVYDFTKPELVEYMRKLISDFFQVYDVDGIKIDGLGQAEGEQLAAEERDTFGDVNKIRMFTMDIYRLVYEEAARSGKDVYIESGWAIPNFATQYAHTFRYGDEFPEFEHRYPAGGLLEHIDYATLQKAVLGQRPNMGMVWGGPESQPMIRLWFEAALAMGTQMTMSTDLTRLSARDLSALRAVLVHYNAFQGETRFVGMPLAQSFATTSDGITYLGALNRGGDTRSSSFKLSDYGLDPQREYLMYDVTSNKYSRVRGSFSVQMAGSSFRLFLLRDTPGVMWTNSSFQPQSDDPRSLKIQLSGPRAVNGFVQLYAPKPSEVRLDGKELERSATLTLGGGYSYDEARGILRLRYRHDRPHTLEVSY